MRPTLNRDKGGSQDAMSELNWAWAQAQEAMK